MGKIELELSNNKLQLQQSMMMRMGMEEEQKRALWLSAARPLPPHSIRISVTADQCSVTRRPPDVTGEMENAVPLPEKWWYIALEKRDKIWNFNISSMITRVEPQNIPMSVFITKPLTDCVLTTSDFQSKIQILLCPNLYSRWSIWTQSKSKPTELVQVHDKSPTGGATINDMIQ